MRIGTRCRIINATVKQNDDAIVIVTGDAGIRHIKDFGHTQCYFIDRKLKTKNGAWRNWTSERQLEPLDDLVNFKQERLLEKA